MDIKKIKSTIPYIVILFIIILAFLAFIGLFSFIPQAEYHFQEPFIINKTVGIDYIISLNFKSSGAFIAGKKIDVEVEISRGIGKRFIQGQGNFVIIGGTDAYEYPLMKKENGIYEGSLIDLKVTNNGDKLIGSKSIFFSSPGEHPIYNALVLFNEDGQFGSKSSNIISISKPEAWLVVEQNKRIFSLSLLIFALTLASLINSRKNKL